MERGRSRSKQESAGSTDITKKEPTLNEFISQRSEGGIFSLTEKDVEKIEDLSQAIINSTPELASTWNSLIKDPNVSNAIVQNPAFQNFLENIKTEPTMATPQYLLKSTLGIEEEDLEQTDEIDDEVDTTSTSSATTTSMTQRKRSPYSSASCRGLYCFDDSDEDDLGISRTTYNGDYDEELDSSDEYDFDRSKSERCCPHCGNKSDYPNGISIPPKSPSKSPKRNRSNSTSSFGAASPPQAEFINLDPTMFRLRCMGLVSMAVIVVYIIYLGNTKGAKSIVDAILPALTKGKVKIN